jgi:hypothetical protein
MPRKTRLPKPRIARPRQLTDFSIDEILGFVAGWVPPRPWEPWRVTERWQSWSEFLMDWDAVRDAWMATDLGRRPPFADRVRSFRYCYGDQALAAATYEQLHDHDPGEDADLERT